jgi:hypothetical protein
MGLQTISMTDQGHEVKTELRPTLRLSRTINDIETLRAAEKRSVQVRSQGAIRGSPDQPSGCKLALHAIRAVASHRAPSLAA